MKNKNLHNILSVGVIIGFVIGFGVSLYHIISHDYISYKMFRLIFLNFQKFLNRFVFLFTVMLLLFYIRWLLFILKTKMGKEKAARFIMTVVLLPAGFLFINYILNVYTRFSLISAFKSFAIRIYDLFKGEISFVFLVDRFKQYIILLMFLSGAIIVMLFLSKLLDKINLIGRIKIKWKFIRKISLALVLLLIILNLNDIVITYANSPKSPNVILIVMDTVRQSNLSCYGYKRKTTPNIDKIAEEGIIFKNAYAIAPWTPPNHSSMFTGLYSCQHGTTRENRSLNSKFLTIAEILSNERYDTVAFTNNGSISPEFGFSQGFKDFYEMWRTPVYAPFIKKYKKDPKDSGAFFTGKAVKEWLHKRRNSRKPFFIFINYMEAHTPYRLPDDYKRLYLDKDTKLTEHHINYSYIDFLAGGYKMTPEDFEISRAIYDAEIKYLDSQIGELVNFLKKENFLKNTILIITSDHGEHFGEHNLVGHQFALYNTLLRVPLIIQFPQKFKGKKHSERYVQLVDIFSTIINGTSSKYPVSINVQGKSLFGQHNREYIFAEYYTPIIYLEVFKKKYPNFDASQYDRRIRSVQFGDNKLIWSSNGKNELYNITDDPGELNNIVDLESQRTERMRKVLFEWFYRIKSDAISRSDYKEKIKDEELKKHLRSLGYIR